MHEKYSFCVFFIYDFWCESLFFGFWFGRPFGHKKQFNANVFLVINMHNFGSLNINENWHKCEISVFEDIAHLENMFILLYWVSRECRKTVFWWKLWHKTKILVKMYFYITRFKIVSRMFLEYRGYVYWLKMTIYKISFVMV